MEENVEALYLVDDEFYLHLQECDIGFDYTTYDRNTLKQLDGGQLGWDELVEQPLRPLPAAQFTVFKELGIEPRSVYSVPMEFLETLQEVNLADAAARREAVLDQLLMERTDPAFAIYQLKRDESAAPYRFMNYRWLSRNGLQAERQNYEHLYTGKLTDTNRSTAELLESIYRRFNLEHPENFRGHSLSVSDIVALKLGKEVSFYYVDSVGFRPLPDFLPAENPLRNAELSLEDDCGMIDGIINNGKRDEAPDLVSQLRRELPKPTTETPKPNGMER